MSPEDGVRLQHMIEASATLARLVKDKSRASLDREEILQLAIARAVEILGEAASRISPETRRTYPDVPWAEAVGIRNRLIHAYFNIDRDILWNAATVEAPRLATRLLEIAGKS